jgi:hypothetical protein
MTIQELAVASRTKGIKTEVVTQGVSGRHGEAPGGGSRFELLGPALDSILRQRLWPSPHLVHAQPALALVEVGEADVGPHVGKRAAAWKQ